MEKSFGLFFFLKKSSYNGDLKTPDIYVKITVNGKACEVSTKRQCERSKWNVAIRNSGVGNRAKAVPFFGTASWYLSKLYNYPVNFILLLYINRLVLQNLSK